MKTHFGHTHFIEDERTCGRTKCGKAYRIGNIAVTNDIEKVTCSTCRKKVGLFLRDVFEADKRIEEMIKQASNNEVIK